MPIILGLGNPKSRVITRRRSQKRQKCNFEPRARCQANEHTETPSMTASSGVFILTTHFSDLGNGAITSASANCRSSPYARHASSKARQHSRSR